MLEEIISLVLESVDRRLADRGLHDLGSEDFAFGARSAEGARAEERMRVLEIGIGSK